MAYKGSIEEKRAYARQWYQAHREVVLTRVKLYASTHKEQISAASKKYRTANHADLKTKSITYTASHRREAVVRAKAWALNHPEETKQRQRGWYLDNKAVLNEKSKQWRLDNPIQALNLGANYRARKREAFIENVDRQQVFLNDAGICQWQYCSEPSPFVDPTNWHLDHIIPLSKGGEHSYMNTQVTHPACNLRKNDSYGV